MFVVDKQFARPFTEGKRTPITVEDLRYHEPHDFVIGMSFKGLNKPRAEKFEMMRSMGNNPRVVVDQDLWIPNSAKIGAGSFIMDRNTIQTGVEIGENCVLWSGNHTGHHTKIGNHVWLSSGIVVSGACEIGDYTFIGSGVTVADGVKIGKRCIIGAGSLVLRDVPDDSVVAAEGTPISKIPSSRAARLLG